MADLSCTLPRIAFKKSPDCRKFRTYLFAGKPENSCPAGCGRCGS